MKAENNLLFSFSPPTHSVRTPRCFANLTHRHRFLSGKPRQNNTGKERDSETGLYYYGARYLDPKASRWLSGDPAMGEYVPSAPINDEARKQNQNLPGMGGVFNYVNLHVYHYAGNNPVKYTDPDGRYIPDPDGNLIAEAGDNAETLADFLGITKENALKQLTDQGYTIDGKTNEVNLESGDSITLDNVYTRSITAAATSPTTDQLLAGKSKLVNDYNCWGAAIAGSKGNEIKKGVGIPTPEQFNGILQKEYSMVNKTEAAFGKTVLKFSNSKGTQHGAVFYGNSNDGTTYVYTKNGWHAKPEVMKLSDLHSKIPSYGSVNGYFNLKNK